ncbi:MAG: hypothetical protein ABI597_12195 [Gammaproteobacteria bacterium]
MANSRPTIEQQFLTRLGQNYNLVTLTGLPTALVNLIVEYWHHLPDGLRCPVSGEILTDPVVILHPHIFPLLYNRQSVIDAIANNELARFTINALNQDTYIVTQPGVNFNSLAGIAAMARSNGSHISVSFEIERERRNAGDVLQPLFSSQPIMARIPERPSVRDFLSLPRSTRLSRAIYTMNNWSLSIFPLLIPMFFGLAYKQNPQRVLEILFRYSQNCVIQYNAIQHLRLHQNYNNRFRYLRQGLAAVIVADSVVMNASFIIPRALVAYPASNLLLGAAFSTAFAFPYLATSNAVLQDIVRGRFREQIKSLATLTPLALLMLASILYQTRKTYIFDNDQLNLALSILTPLIHLPYSYLSVRETANTLANTREYIRHPSRLLQNPSDTFAERNESIPAFASRNLLRLFAALSAGFLMYAATENPLAAILALCSVYMQGSLMYGIGTMDSRYRLLPRPIAPALPAPNNDDVTPLASIMVTPLHIEEEKKDEAKDAVNSVFRSDSPREFKEEKRSLDEPSDDLNIPLLSRRFS